MGICNYKDFLRLYFNDAFMDLDLKKVRKYHHIYIDLNHFLHNAMYGVSSKKAFFVKLFKNLRFILSRVVPSKSITVGIDGPSPFAKIILQRKRRMESTIDPNGEITSLHLTPGTGLMKEINKEVKTFFDSWIQKFKLYKVSLNFYGADTPDEGEIKIFKKLKENGKKDLSHSHLVIGNDADLIVIGMASYPVKKIDILIKSPQVKFQILSMFRLININHKILKVKAHPKDIRNDFVVLSILMGNDYLKKLNFLDPMKMVKAYYTYRPKQKEGITKFGNFNNKFFSEFMLHCNHLLAPQYRKYAKLDNLNSGMIKEYLSTIRWCWNLYDTGVCPMYNFSYTSNKTPSPLEVHLFFKLNPNKMIPIPRSNFKPISEEAYPLLVFNPRVKELIQDKHLKLFDNELKYLKIDFNELYKFRGKCTEVSKKIKDYKIKNDTKSTSKELRDEINKAKKDLSDYKDKHIHNFCNDDIEKIISLVEKC